MPVERSDGQEDAFFITEDVRDHNPIKEENESEQHESPSKFDVSSPKM